MSSSNKLHTSFFTQGEKIQFTGLPVFAPEFLKTVRSLDPMKSKQLNKGLLQLCEEGVAQLFKRDIDGRSIIGTVGVLPVSYTHLTLPTNREV